MTYYQPEVYSDDGTNIVWVFPEELFSFQVFETEEDCLEFMENCGYDVKDVVVHEYHDDDIEEPTFIDSNGNFLHY